MTTRQYFSLQNTLFFALLSGQVFFAGLAVYMQSQGSFGTGDADFARILLVVAVVVAVSAVAASVFITKTRLVELKAVTKLSIKLDKYRGVLITKWALLEGPVFFSIVCFMITGEYLFLGIGAVLFIVFITGKPSEDKVISDLELEGSDRDAISNPEAEVL
jgi:hypothetical protein